MKKPVMALLTVVFVCASAFAQSKKSVVVRPKPKSVPASSLQASIARGQAVYTKYCLTCHQADGGGVPNINPPLIQTTYVLGDKKRLTQIVLHGFSERVEIDGDLYSNNMPPHPFLTDQQIADVLTFVRNSFGNKASAVKPSEVKQARGGSKK